MQNSETLDKQIKDIYKQLSEKKMIIDKKEDEIGDLGAVIKGL